VYKSGLLTSDLVLPKNTGLASSNSMVSGSVVYGFQTPKRHGGLAQAASSALHNKTPSNHMQHSLGFHRQETPKGVKKGKRIKFNDVHNRCFGLDPEIFSPLKVLSK